MAQRRSFPAQILLLLMALTTETLTQPTPSMSTTPMSTTLASTTPTSTTSTSITVGSGTDTAAIVGITVGVVVTLVIIGLFVWLHKHYFDTTMKSEMAQMREKDGLLVVEAGLDPATRSVPAAELVPAAGSSPTAGSSPAAGSSSAAGSVPAASSEPAERLHSIDISGTGGLSDAYGDIGY